MYILCSSRRKFFIQHSKKQEFEKYLSIAVFAIMIVTATLGTEANTSEGDCKSVLQGYLTGQLASTLGAYQIEALKREFNSFKEIVEGSIKAFKEKMSSDLSKEKKIFSKSAVYTRWGKKKCPSNAQLVYSGFTAGSSYSSSGSAVEPLCLPRNPQWGIYKDGKDGSRQCMYGAEYETSTLQDRWKKLHNHDVPCAVCRVRGKSVTQVIPARTHCYKGWTKEYSGYLMSGYYGSKAASMFTCIDKNPDTLHGGHVNKDGYLFYPVEGRCGSLKCPPYVEGRELTCVVCSAV